MFTVRCPANLLWHPSLHHSLLLLRGLRQPHTLLLENAVSLGSSHGTGLAFPPLVSSAVHVSVSREDGQLTRVNAPEHIPWMLALSCEGEQHRQGQSLLPQKDMLAYLETSLVSSHLLSGVDALLVALSTGEMETTRRLHAALMDSVTLLDDTLQDDAVSQEAGGSSSVEEPLSTWPLYAVLQFLIEQGGLLTSAYPRVLAAYTRLSKEIPVGHHSRLIQRTIDATATSAPEVGEQVSTEYPAAGFLVEVQRRLAEYTTSAEERITEGVTGDKGPLHSRISGGRMGLQTVPARMPWTVEQIPLQRRR